MQFSLKFKFSYGLSLNIGTHLYSLLQKLYLFLNVKNLTKDYICLLSIQ